MKKALYILSFLPLVAAAQLYVGSNALIHITDGANLEVGGDLENGGAIQNLGMLSLYGDWSRNNNFNGSEGSIQFLGAANQRVSADQLTFKELIVNLDGVLTFPGSEYLVTDRLEFKFGTVETGTNTRFVLGENILIPAESGSNDSYFEGALISRLSGTSDLVFPVGSNGIYAPLTLREIVGFGEDTEIQVSHNRGIPVDPEPGDSLLGVSYKSYWEMELLAGEASSSQVQLEFSEEDLSDFKIFNNIRFRSSTPAVAFTENITNRWQSLFVSELIETDSLTFGTITSDIEYMPRVGQKAYFAVALAPTVPENQPPYIPEVFSPNAKDPDNKTFKIFGPNISNENFSLQIYNKLGIRVYSTNSFTEANQFGWDGTNASTGADEPTGIYYYSIKLTFGRDRPFSKSGAFYLVR